MFQSRTHTCNELRMEHVGQTVKLVGWMENVREVGSSLAFVILRDFYGTTQIVLETEDMMAAMPENGLHFNPGFAPSHDHFAKQGCKYAERCRERRAQCSQVPPFIDVNGHQVRCWKYA